MDYHSSKNHAVVYQTGRVKESGGDGGANPPFPSSPTHAPPPPPSLPHRPSPPGEHLLRHENDRLGRHTYLITALYRIMLWSDNTKPQYALILPFIKPYYGVIKPYYDLLFDPTYHGVYVSFYHINYVSITILWFG